MERPRPGVWERVVEHDVVCVPPMSMWDTLALHGIARAGESREDVAIVKETSRPAAYRAKPHDSSQIRAAGPLPERQGSSG